MSEALPGKRDGQRHGPILSHRKFLIIWEVDQKFGNNIIGKLMGKK